MSHLLGQRRLPRQHLRHPPAAHLPPPLLNEPHPPDLPYLLAEMNRPWLPWRDACSSERRSASSVPAGSLDAPTDVAASTSRPHASKGLTPNKFCVSHRRMHPVDVFPIHSRIEFEQSLVVDWHPVIKRVMCRYLIREIGLVMMTF